MISRRLFIGGLLVGTMAPAIVRAESLMVVKRPERKGALAEIAVQSLGAEYRVYRMNHRKYSEIGSVKNGVWIPLSVGGLEYSSAETFTYSLKAPFALIS